MEKTLCFVINNIELFLDINIVTFDIPLLFICSDKDNQKYLVLCSDSQELRYLVARIDNSILIKMLKSEITMKDAFKHSNKIWEIISQEEIGDDIINVVEFSNISKEDLPEEGAFLNYMSKDIAEYIEQIECNILSSEIQNAQNVIRTIKMTSLLITSISITKQIIDDISHINKSIKTDYFEDSTSLSDYQSFNITHKYLEGDTICLN